MNSLRCLLTKRGRVWASNATLNTSKTRAPSHARARVCSESHGVFVFLQVRECFKVQENSGENSEEGQVETESQLQNQQARVLHRGRRDGGAQDQPHAPKSGTKKIISHTQAHIKEV